MPHADPAALLAAIVEIERRRDRRQGARRHGAFVERGGRADFSAGPPPKWSAAISVP
ncbi:hypothetical protein ACFSTD_08775 [Novosphingobium colocasiae]